ncbi:MAG: hypothetical protein Q4B26_01250, partial [Eubacteriales bacterium]|nr:hypothetical protein [Eubacteriales bacterium]
MTKTNTCTIDLEALGEKHHLATIDIVENDRVVDTAWDWNTSDLQKILEECKSHATGCDYVRLTGRVPNWLLSAIAFAVYPSVCSFQFGSNGEYHWTATPFPIDASVPTTLTHFEVTETETEVYVNAVSEHMHADNIDITEDELFHIIMPPISAGKLVYLSGITAIPISVSMALTYGDISRAIFQRPLSNPYYFCVLSHTP